MLAVPYWGSAFSNKEIPPRKRGLVLFGFCAKAVFESYGVDVVDKGDQLMAFCPLPTHEGTGKSKSFSANTKKGIFQCFGCQAKGNILEFCIRMEGFDPEDKKAFREGALIVQERFGGDATKTAAAKRDKLEEKVASADEVPTEEEAEVPRAVNAPLDFELKSLDRAHWYLTKRRLTPETIQYFGLGYSDRGLMKGRVVIPLHDWDGKLIGYAGRLVDDEAIDDDHPKYLLPGKRTVKGVRHEFWKSELLFNGHRIEAPVSDLIVVEGFFGAMWLHQCGYRNTVAVMGASCSQRQIELIHRLTRDGSCICVIPDGDDAGAKMGESVVVQLAQERMVRWLRLPGGNEPDSISEKSVGVLLAQVGL